ncbi:hypothetical protein ASF75_14575 [Curtobacterium sp. Leaf154]|nr:hypothetical protein ASF75_14575 [Curtobacterium sp. Leaf154]
MFNANPRSGFNLGFELVVGLVNSVECGARINSSTPVPESQNLLLGHQLILKKVEELASVFDLIKPFDLEG